MLRPLFTPGRTRYLLYKRLGGPVWTGAENLTPTRIQSLDCPARSQSLYQLHYLAHYVCMYVCMYVRNNLRTRCTDWNQTTDKGHRLHEDLHVFVLKVFSTTHT
jgi:hypothetical protein